VHGELGVDAEGIVRVKGLRKTAKNMGNPMLPVYLANACAQFIR